MKTTLDALAGVRTALKAWTTPLLPDDYTALLNPLWSTRELRGKVVKVTKHNNDTISLDVTPGWGVPVDFAPGQYIGVGVQVNGRYVWRSYSLTNVSGADKLFSITVKAQQGGRLSEHLVECAQPGMNVRIARPAGDFHLPDPIPEKLLFLAAGTGITPIVAMIRALELRSPNHDAVLVYSARTEQDALFIEELRQVPGLTCHLRITSEQGRVTPEEVGNLVPDYAERAPFACGPGEMLEALAKWWDEGVEKRHELRTERFTLDRTSDAEGGLITFGAKGQVQADGATTILEAAESEGIQLPFGCRMGICHTCVQTIKDGAAHNLTTGEAHELGERIRTCVCVARGDLTLDV
ncbi:Stearoyl-CoA 9-desaturase electron transfer partner [Corynebacterium kalinowskii]|uniref:Stearoyl-CoA 9-desaturase electron transfer partner n=1 Tax=Corynebacterium kalinowskii TaxID=2675216 RepID=A0A6B8W604_9CORY|nr:ferredoxin reductase [Corynebacterium kalinowskii]QGU02678.1 Stearoyl-CoA 9-desaturase electron transfer partner [Corynebacterium kalinowskii]